MLRKQTILGTPTWRAKDVLARLRHGTVGGGYDQDRAVHLRGAGDHVLDVVGVTGTIHVGVVPRVRFVFDVGGRDCDGLGRVALGATLGDVLISLGGDVRNFLPARASSAAVSVVLPWSM